MTADPATIAWYAANAAQHVPGFDRAPSRHLDPFLDRLEPAARILELGCGGGRDSARIAARGFALDPTDGTRAMVDKAAEHTGLAARLLRFEDLSACDAYDAVWAHACLIHVPRSDLPAILARIRAALRPGGWHFANFKLGKEEGRDPLGRLHNFPAADWLEATYGVAGFELVACETYPGKGADGVKRDWLALTVRKPG